MAHGAHKHPLLNWWKNDVSAAEKPGLLTLFYILAGVLALALMARLVSFFV